MYMGLNLNSLRPLKHAVYRERFACFRQVYGGLQDYKIGLKLIISDGNTVEPVLRFHCHERPPVSRDQIFFMAEGPTFQRNWNCLQWPPVLRGHIFCGIGVGVSREISLYTHVCKAAVSIISYTWTAMNYAQLHVFKHNVIAQLASVDQLQFDPTIGTAQL